MNEKLKPCPFCGQVLPELAIENVARRYVMVDDDFEYEYRIVCSNGHLGALCSTKEQAIQDWNKRKEAQHDEKAE